MRRTILLLTFLLASSLHAASDLFLNVASVEYPLQLPYSRPFQFSVHNLGPDPASAITVRFTVPRPFRFERSLNANWSCSETSGSVVCQYDGTLPVGQLAFGAFELASTELTPGTYPMDVSIDAIDDPQPANNARRVELRIIHQFLITTNADAGPGSLREAIHAANAHCGGAIGCRITSDYWVWVGARYTIRLETPLPPITACNLTIEPRFAPIHTEPRLVELDGSTLTHGNGFEIRTRCSVKPGVTISGFSIGGFPDNGILINSDDAPSICHVIWNNTIGLDRNGSEPRPNASRGIAVESPRSCARIESNYIGANRRSGIALWAAAPGTSIFGNHIGWGSDPGRPMPNQASGIFTIADHVSIGHNNIAFNHHFGVAIGRGLRNVGVFGNSVHSNGGLPVDWGLDGSTPNDSDESDGIPNTPVLTSTETIVIDHFDWKESKTTVRGRLRSRKEAFGGTYTIILYVNSPNSAAEAFSAVTSFEVTVPAGVFDVPFEAVLVNQVAKGQILTAQTLIRDANGESISSELSEGIEVR